MKIERFRINNIPSLLWGEKSSKLFIAVHGNMSNKEDVVIKLFAEKIVPRGYQLLSFDLPEHGERKNDTHYLCKVQNCIHDLTQVMNYVRNLSCYQEINLWANSMGAYFSLLTFKNENIHQCIFLSPVVNMKVIIENMMKYNNTTEIELMEKQEIKTNFGPTLYWDYYTFVKENPVTQWDKNTYILYGSKDNMQEEFLMKEFSSQFNCKLSILENGEHFFHTEEQLNYYKNWLDRIII